MKRDNGKNWQTAVGLLIQTPNPEGNVGVPVIVWGMPGHAKTALTRLIAKSLNKQLTTVIGASKEPGDFEISRWNPDTGTYGVHAPQWWLETIAKGEEGALFLDEMSCAPPSVQAILLDLIHSRQLGGKVGAKTAVVGAANPTDVAAGGWEPALPTLNRTLHLNAGRMGNKAFAAYCSREAMGESHEDALDIPVLDLDTWNACRGEALVIAESFALAKGDLFDVDERGIIPAEEPSYPTPRSFMLGIHAYAAAQAVGRADLADELMAAAVGTGVATQYATHKRMLDLPNAAEVLDGKIPWEPNPNRIDRVKATMASVMREAVSRKTHEAVAAGYEVIQRCHTMPDIAFQMYGALRKHSMGKGWAKSGLDDKVPAFRALTGPNGVVARQAEAIEAIRKGTRK